MPKMPKKKKKNEDTSDEEEEERIIELLYQYILQMVLIMGGEDSEQTREQIVDIMVLSAQLQEVRLRLSDVQESDEYLNFLDRERSRRLGRNLQQNDIQRTEPIVRQSDRLASVRKQSLRTERFRQ